jgi:hypothetical protein
MVCNGCPPKIRIGYRSFAHISDVSNAIADKAFICICTFAHDCDQFLVTVSDKKPIRAKGRRILAKPLVPVLIVFVWEVL